MTFEVIGLVNHYDVVTGQDIPAQDFDPAFIDRCANIHEASGFDRVLIANTATMPDNFAIAAFLAGKTSKLNFLCAHRPNFVPPTIAARQLATLDRLTGGRVATHIIVGADDIEVQADGAFNTKEERYQMAGEYVEVMRKVWASDKPFDHEGEYYKFRGAFASIRPSAGAIPVCWGGLSGSAIEMAARHADIYAMGGDTVAAVKDVVDQVKAAEKRHGRKLDQMMTINVITAETEDAAWERANKIMNDVDAMAARNNEKTPEKVAAIQMQRLLDRAKEGDVLDKRLWQGLNRAMRGRGNNSVLVGTPDQVVDSLMDYHAIGIDRFLLRGPALAADAELMGKELIPTFRAKVAEVTRAAEPVA